VDVYAFTAEMLKQLGKFLTDVSIASFCLILFVYFTIIEIENLMLIWSSS
jgi:hypothetical protein